MVDNRLDLLAQELEFVPKSEEREALESLLRGRGVFLCPTNRPWPFSMAIIVHCLLASSLAGCLVGSL